MESNLAQLVKDINQADYCKIIIYIHTGSEVIAKPMTYEKLRIKGDRGKIFLGDIESNEGYLVSDNNEIIRTDNLSRNNRLSYTIRSEGIVLLELDIYNKKDKERQVVAG